MRAAQLRALRDYASKKGYMVAREFVDEAESGRIADRPWAGTHKGCPYGIGAGRDGDVCAGEAAGPPPFYAASRYTLRYGIWRARLACGVSLMSAETRSGSPTSDSGTSCEGTQKWPSRLHRFAETLANPDAVRPSRSSPTVHLYYRLYPDLRSRNRYICLVVKRERTYAFILTGYLARSIKGERA